EKAAYCRFLDVGDVPALAGDAGGVYRDVGGRSSPTKKAKKPRIAAFWTWVMFLLSLATLVVFIVMSVVDH
ncbi:hypothetical protein V5H41_29450, partial [Salmonella enterica]